MMEVNKSILIIDDDPGICYTIREICKSQNWNGISTDDYNKAKNILLKQKIDLILVDYHMPQMNGITVVKKIREKYRTLPIIVLTVEEGKSVFKSFMEAGADDYSLKPIKVIDLVARINVHLKYKENYKYYNDVPKRISKITLTKLTDFLQEKNDYADVEEIEERTGIKQKTAYRYLQYLVEEAMVEQEPIYGKTGRPRMTYKLK